MELSCHLKEYSEEWDKKLNLILDKGVFVKNEDCDKTLTFQLTTITCKKRLWWSVKEEEVETYRVWISNKDCAYGTLYYFNDKSIPASLEVSPSQVTMQRLYEFEVSTYLTKFKDIYDTDKDYL